MPINDYGFSTFTVDELKAESNALLSDVERLQNALMDQKLRHEQRLGELVDLVMPLLVRLRDTANQDYILWPNRRTIMDGMIKKIEEIQDEE